MSRCLLPTAGSSSMVGGRQVACRMCCVVATHGHEPHGVRDSPDRLWFPDRRHMEWRGAYARSRCRATQTTQLRPTLLIVGTIRASRIELLKHVFNKLPPGFQSTVQTRTH